ncbi:MAG: CPBP family glutamic-type intramembrane protease [Propionibacteriaceae bacterium]
MRLSPRPWLGLVALAAYLVVVFVIQGTSGVPYTDLSASAANLWRDAILSIAVASVVVAALATWWGWWSPALFERTRARRWTIIAPAFVLVLAVLNLVFTRWSSVGIDFVVAGLVVGVLVGFGEEFTTRGLLLVGLRGRLREVFVWLFTCLAFGLIHGVNILLGAPVSTTLQQIVLAAAQGSAFYALRRVTGSLIWAMALHGLWDFSVFVIGTSGGANPFGILTFVSAAVSVVFGFLATKDASTSAPAVRDTAAAVKSQ